MNLKEVKIELTNYCKRGCIHCSSDANTEHLVQLSIEEIKKVVEEASRLGVCSIVLTGGEATEFAGIEEVVAYIYSKEIRSIKLYTMCEPTLEKLQLINKLTKLGLTDVIYSLTVALTTDGAVTYDNVVEFLQKISEIVDLSFHYCLTTKTTQDIEQLEKVLVQIKKFKYLSFLRYVEHGRGKDDLILSNQELNKVKVKILELMKKYPDKIHLGSPFNILDITNIKCSAGEDVMIVGFDGNVYPCDAMKYFDFLGSGGNIGISSLEEIYDSEYFKEIRAANKNINEQCRKCRKDKCMGGCLAQKMLEVIKKCDAEMTVRWYQENALRTMNDFANLDVLRLNAYMGIIGEAGEFFDYMKKLYTHNLSEEKKQEIMVLAPKELGDLIWYLSTSLAVYYDYTLDEVYDYMIQSKRGDYQIDKNLIQVASWRKDPLCGYYHQEKSYPVDSINRYVDLKYQASQVDERVMFEMLRHFKKLLNQLDYVDTKAEVVEIVSKILIEIAMLAKVLFDKNLSDILNDTIEKLRLRYPTGFSSEVADRRIDANKMYRREENYKLVLQKKKV